MIDRPPLRAHLLATLVSGDTRTPRSNVVSHAEKLAAGDPDKFLGLGDPGCDPAEVMRAVAGLCGCSPSLEEREGPGYIDPERTLDGLEASARRLARAARAGERILVTSGHPTGVVPMYQRIVRALERAGAKVLAPLEDEHIGEDPFGRRRSMRIRYLDGVGVLCDGASVFHTHESWPMERLLEECAPSLVLADHGFAGAAIARGVETIAFTDVNDPAIALAHHRGLVEAVVPLDDNVAPRLYEPLAEALEGVILGPPA